MKRYSALTWIFAAIAATPSQARFDAQAAAKMLAPFIDEQTFAIVRVDLSAVDIDALQDTLTKAGAPAKDLAAPRKAVRDILGRLQSAGAKEVYAVLSLADFPMPGPFVVIPVAEGADSAALSRVLDELNVGSTWVSHNVVVGGPPKSIDRLKKLTPSPRPDLAAALGAFPDAMLEAVLVPSADQRRVVEEQFPKLPGEIGGGSGAVVTKGIKWAAAAVTTKPQLAFHAVIQSPDASAAQALHDVVKKALEFAARAGQEMKLDLAAVAPALTPKVSGDRLTLDIRADDEAVVKLLASAAQRTRAAAGRTRSMNNLKQLALAMYNYNDTHQGLFPTAANLSKDGKPLLSWRVHILPYLEQDALYKQFRLDEPWDSEHNKALIAKMPEVFRSPAQKVGDGKTTYLAPVGKDTVIVRGNKGMRIADVTDGTSNTILICEVNDEAAVVWTKPDDFDADGAEVLKKLVGHYPEGFLAAFADGSVRFIRKSIDPKLLKALFTRSGGEVVGPIP